MKPLIKIFLDTSVIIAALLSPEGGSAQIATFCEAKLLQGFVSSDVKKELTEVIQKKFPEAKSNIDKLLQIMHLKTVKKLKPALFKKALKWISHHNDAKILAAAVQSETDYLLTLDIRHFLKNPAVAQKSNLKICTPGNFLQIFRNSF